MNYNEFVESITGFLRESMPGDTQLEMIPLTKNNGVVKEGLSVRKKGKSIAPTIYLDAYYQEYLEGRCLSGICEQILDCCGDKTLEDRFSPDFFADYKKLRRTIVYKLINKAKNEELLSKIPYLPYLDFAIVFYCLIAGTPTGNATILVHNSHMEMWGVGIRDLFMAAKENAARMLPAKLDSMAEVIRELSGGFPQTYDDDIPMYVLTNSAKIFGAACILYDGMLEICSMKLGGDFYLLPSSIHEVILLPEWTISEESELQRIVREINITQVRDTEVLSDNVYYYSEQRRMLTMI